MACDTCSYAYIGVGKFRLAPYPDINNNTPVGKVTIINMCLDPEKSARGTNDPVTEMKLRWIGLSKFSGERGGFGFHGTQYPDSIPGQTSKGCIRMRDEDVVELYDIVRPGNEVEIRA